MRLTAVRRSSCPIFRGRIANSRRIFKFRVDHLVGRILASVNDFSSNVVRLVSGHVLPVYLNERPVQDIRSVTISFWGLCNEIIILNY
jgi:hypothetical protein